MVERSFQTSYLFENLIILAITRQLLTHEGRWRIGACSLDVNLHCDAVSKLLPSSPPPRYVTEDDANFAISATKRWSYEKLLSKVVLPHRFRPLRSVSFFLPYAYVLTTRLYTATTPCIQRNFLRAGRQEVITLNIHRLRKGEAGVSLIVPLTEIRPSRVISLPVSFAFDPRPMRFDFHSLRKEERERKRKAGGRGKEKERIDFSP